MPKISIIIPHGENEIKHQDLVSFFEELNDPDLEIVTCQGTSRANAMNHGAAKAKYDYLWFVHADTQLSSSHISALNQAIENKPDCLHYFKLAYLDDGPRSTSLNAYGANFRSKILGLPWGDQAFCIKREIFELLGTYDERAQYGEDHLLVWKAHQEGVKLNALPLAVLSSARYYQDKGWFKGTVQRQYYWIKQAVPEFFKLIKYKAQSQ